MTPAAPGVSYSRPLPRRYSGKLPTHEITLLKASRKSIIAIFHKIFYQQERKNIDDLISILA